MSKTDNPPPQMKMQEAIDKAVAIERERCARIAEGSSLRFDFLKALENHDDLGYGRNGAQLDIARAIREGSSSPAPQNHVVGDRALEAALEIERLRHYCQQLLDILDNYQVEIEGEDNDLIAMIGRHVDPGYVEPATTPEGSAE